MEEYEQAEMENRVRNLMWTVSGDYNLDTKLDTGAFTKSKYISIYDAIKQGAFARFFDKDLFGMYLMKKVFLGAEESSLSAIGQLCVDSAVFRKVSRERPGVPEIRRKAFEDILDFDFGKMTASLPGQVKLMLLRGYLTGRLEGERRLLDVALRIRSLEESGDTMDLIRTVDEIYNAVLDKTFEKKKGTLDQVMSVSAQQLKQFDWQDYLNEEMQQDQMERYMNQLLSTMSNLSEEEEKPKGSGGAVYLTQEAVDKMYSYIELNYGTSYLSPLEQKRLNHKVCRGAHADCSLYFTDGILAGMVKVNSQSEYARKTKEINQRVFRQNQRMTRRNIEMLSDILKRALMLRSQQESCAAENGQVVPAKLWNVGRTGNKMLFEKVIKRDSSDFVVDVLIDASGSQRLRQSQVALQAYIISEALSNVGIPHRVMGFCTFWDYTVMRRFREYDEGREANDRIFEFYGSSNNRDGLAVRAAALSLQERGEEHKILIVLSDGRPNDIIVNRPNSKNPAPYFGDYAVRDTAYEVRKLRNAGIAVLGVFAGEEQDLYAERRIFGKDFAYIRDIANFSHVVGRYLKKQVSDE
ncbi:MAG: nitric oxide reductase activation protein [Lachnospiraceae bacterium]|nr:nitric oxide reductase activation protein [Lachnospiraceae bacterium]